MVVYGLMHMKINFTILLIGFAIQYATAQEVIRSSRQNLAVQQQAERFTYHAGFGLGFNQLQQAGSNFGFEVLGTLVNELELKRRVRFGLLTSFSLAGLNRTVILNNGSRFDEDRVPTGGVVAPYVGLALLRSRHITLAPQVGYQWHFFSSEDIEQADPYQFFSAKGMDFGLVVEYHLPMRQDQTKKRDVRMFFNYARLNIEGQPSMIEMYGMQVYITLRMFERRSGSQRN